MRQTIASMLAGEDHPGLEAEQQGMELACEALQAPRPPSEGGVCCFQGECRYEPGPRC